MDRLRRALLAAFLVPAATFCRVAGAQSQEEIEAALELYRYRIVQSGTRLRSYPEEALRQQLEGAASTELVVAGDGSLKSIRLVASSGHALLDETAIDMLTRAVPLTQIPSTLQNKAFVVRIVIVFKLPS